MKVGEIGLPLVAEDVVAQLEPQKVWAVFVVNPIIPIRIEPVIEERDRNAPRLQREHAGIHHMQAVAAAVERSVHLARDLYCPDVAAVRCLVEDVVEAAIDGGACTHQFQREFHRRTIAAADVYYFQIASDANGLPRAVVARDGAGVGTGDNGSDVRRTNTSHDTAIRHGAPSSAERIHARGTRTRSRTRPPRRHCIERLQMDQTRRHRGEQPDADVAWVEFNERIALAVGIFHVAAPGEGSRITNNTRHVVKNQVCGSANSGYFTEAVESQFSTDYSRLRRAATPQRKPPDSCQRYYVHGEQYEPRSSTRRALQNGACRTTAIK